MGMRIGTRPSKYVKGATDIMVVIDHVMQVDGQTDPKTKQPIKPNWLQKAIVQVNGATLAEVDLNYSVSKNPNIHLTSKALKIGDTIKVSWTDSEGKKGEGDHKVAKVG